KECYQFRHFLGSQNSDWPLCKYCGSVRDTRSNFGEWAIPIGPFPSFATFPFFAASFPKADLGALRSILVSQTDNLRTKQTKSSRGPVSAFARTVIIVGAFSLP
ncbi:hypothetical protein, partial [Roseovarius aestuarii]|uniref:hypothetical protein n=1 Tax=Roseovarius aestuarii TaxID=475083 RepID=UPI001C37F110